jgi:hypothetical protein
MAATLVGLGAAVTLVVPFHWANGSSWDAPLGGAALAGTGSALSYAAVESLRRRRSPR